MGIAEHIQHIGGQMVQCARQCDGISLNPAEGVLPRCLILETKNRHGKVGAVVVGVNPARSSKEERRYYQTAGLNYGATVAYWEAHIGYRHPYYRRMREFVSLLGFDGPILWTELVKCEDAVDKPPSLQTFRTCSRLYLQRELEAVPHDWPLVVASGEAYRATAYMFAERTVIGLPHPTGSYGRQFHRFSDPDSLVKIKHFLRTTTPDENRHAVWILDLLA